LFLQAHALALQQIKEDRERQRKKTATSTSPQQVPASDTSPQKPGTSAASAASPDVEQPKGNEPQTTMIQVWKELNISIILIILSAPTQMYM
jgi:hypothetical protein